MKEKFLIFAIAVMIIFSSCEKESISRNQFAGVWKIDKMIQTYYSDTNSNPNPDSVITTRDAGIFMLVDRKDYNNILDYDKSSFGDVTPKFFQVGGSGWSTDISGTRLSLSGVVYTVEDLFFDRYKLTYVEGIYAGIFHYKEEIFINRFNP